MYIFDWPYLSYFILNFFYMLPLFLMCSTMGYLTYCRDGISVALFWFCEEVFVLNFIGYEGQGVCM